jgi:hydroxyacylglutathione hydrolase
LVYRLKVKGFLAFGPFAKRAVQLVAWLILASTASAQSDPKSLTPGTFPDSWETTPENCAQKPEFQIHAYNDDFYILRQSRCISIQKPFLYLIFGEGRAILVDTGGVWDLPDHSDIVNTVLGLVDEWKEANSKSEYMLFAAHTHTDAGHVGGDRFLKNLDGVTLMSLGVKAISRYYGIENWPNSTGSFDLGDRVLDIIPIPGHDADAIEIYDRATGILLTGDSLYPGNIYTDGGLEVFRASNKRMIDFLADKPLAHVLGSHIYYSSTPFRLAGPGLAEHKLQLGRAHLLEMQYELDKMDGKVTPLWLRDFRNCRTYTFGC